MFSYILKKLFHYSSPTFRNLEIIYLLAVCVRTDVKLISLATNTRSALAREKFFKKISQNKNH